MRDFWDNLRDFWYDWGGLIIIVLLIIGLLAGVLWLGQAVCSAMTANMGMSSSWGVMSGCRVQVADQVWVPLDNYRFFGE
jgi:hypothetical protein